MNELIQDKDFRLLVYDIFFYINHHPKISYQQVKNLQDVIYDLWFYPQHGYTTDNAIDILGSVHNKLKSDNFTHKTFKRDVDPKSIELIDRIKSLFNQHLSI